MTTGTSSPTPLDLPLDRPGTVLVEASAGTGKTHALTTLVARLVVEEGREIDEILVVTFTRAATAELKDRIRRTLKAAREAVQAAMAQRGCETGAQARELLERWTGPAGVDLGRSARRLDAALQDIDRASVYTIHGFCQRVLGDLAFEGGFPFGFEVSGDDRDLTENAVRDFWRRRFYDASLVLVRYAVDNEFLPGALAQWTAAGRTKPGLRIAGAEAPERPLDTYEAEWRRVFEVTRARWDRHGEAFRLEMVEGKWLNRSRYQVRTVERRLTLVEKSFASPEPRLWDEGIASWFGQERVSGACRKNATLPDNPLFDDFDLLEEASRPLRAAFERWLRWARAELIGEVRAAAQRRVREERRLRYDDLLIEVEAALDSRGGAQLAESIRRAHPCALIDEFQDTDQVQARIFSRVYGEVGRARDGTHATPASLFVVGDPKQSIYRFRGADIFAYLGTRRRASRVLALDRNWRSVPGLVAAVNEMFAAPLPFALPEIGYRAVSAARDAEGPSPDAPEGEREPFALRLFPPGPDDRPWNKGDASRVAAEAVASEIAGLLGPVPKDAGERAAGEIAPNQDHFTPAEPVHPTRTTRSRVDSRNSGDAGGGVLSFPRMRESTQNNESGQVPRKREMLLAPDGEARRGSDIAVLVRTRRQGQLVARALRERGIRTAEVSEESVFDTHEAEQLERLLRCLAEPVPETEVRGALAGDLFALDTAGLLAMDEDDEVWSAWRERLHAWRRCWKTEGIGALLLRLLELEGGAERLLRHRDGARRLTNYRHLAELLLDVEAGSRLTPSGLAGWLGRRRQAETRDREESVLLRLDSDEQLVRILTVHGSKGLEFPIVFYPFAWDVPDPERRGTDADVAYHEGEGEVYREVLDLDPDSAARDAARVEEFSESLRLLYVAFTRARDRCIVTWGPIKGAERSPLAWLLHRGAEVRAGILDTNSDEGDTEEASGANSAIPARTVRSGRSARSRGRNSKTIGTRRSPVPVIPAKAGIHERREAMGGIKGAAERTGSAPGPVAAPEAIDALDAVEQRFKGLAWNEWRDEVQAFAVRCPGAVSVNVLEPDEPRPLPPEAHPPPALEARGPVRPLRLIRQMTSYSALAAEGARATGVVAQALVERPDHDAGDTPSPRAGEEGDTSPGDDGTRSAFTFPRGAIAGSCVHQVFERLDRTPAGDPTPDLDVACRDALRNFGFEDAWHPVLRTMIERTRAVRLHEPLEPERKATARDASSTPMAGANPTHDDDAGEGVHDRKERGAAAAPLQNGARRTGEAFGSGPARGFRLADPIRRIAEMEFHFPVAGLVRGRLAACLAEHGYPHPFGDGAESGEAGERPPIDGFLRGFVDLVVEHEGRWYIIDYKSNWLGPDLASYAPAALRRATFAGGYPLQYLVYLVALHRHLRARLPGYDYERHMGGVFYLYLRGIDPAAGMSRGVYFDRPARACIQALDDCFRGTTSMVG